MVTKLACIYTRFRLEKCQLQTHVRIYINSCINDMYVRMCTVYTCVSRLHVQKFDSTVDHSNHTLSPSPGIIVDECLPKQLLSFCQEIADGMRYLSRRGFIHRDLAASTSWLLQTMFITSLIDRRITV